VFKNILVAVDLEDGAGIDDLLRAAADIANTHRSQVHLLNVIASAPAVVSRFLPENYEKMAAREIEKDLAALAATVDLAEGAAASSVRFGDVYQEILAYAGKIGADLIIVASHKPDLGDYLLGTTAARIVRHASCSTLVIRQSRSVRGR
jgi:nucleotide-binding universal stress UspA family protein